MQNGLHLEILLITQLSMWSLLVAVVVVGVLAQEVALAVTDHLCLGKRLAAAHLPNLQFCRLAEVLTQSLLDLVALVALAHKTHQVVMVANLPLVASFQSGAAAALVLTLSPVDLADQGVAAVDLALARVVREQLAKVMVVVPAAGLQIDLAAAAVLVKQEQAALLLQMVAKVLLPLLTEQRHSALAVVVAVGIKDRLEDLVALVVVDMDKLMEVQLLKLEQLTLAVVVAAAVTQQNLVCPVRLVDLAL